jgi:hypothetical protein
MAEMLEVAGLKEALSHVNEGQQHVDLVVDSMSGIIESSRTKFLSVDVTGIFGTILDVSSHRETHAKRFEIARRILEKVRWLHDGGCASILKSIRENASFMFNDPTASMPPWLEDYVEFSKLLGEIGGTESVRQLVGLLEEGVAPKEVAYALGKTGKDDLKISIPALLKLAENPPSKELGEYAELVAKTVADSVPRKPVFETSKQLAYTVKVMLKANGELTWIGRGKVGKTITGNDARDMRALTNEGMRIFKSNQFFAKTRGKAVLRVAQGMITK